MKLDKSRPFSVVYGDARARYEQDGRLFDSRGEALDELSHVSNGREILHLRKTRDNDMAPGRPARK